MAIVRTLEGGLLYRSPEGARWRTYEFIEGARTYDKVEDLRMVYEASYAFGRFQKQLSDMPGGRLLETIPDFHHTQKRFKTFLDVLEKDPKNRARDAKPEIDFVLRREADAGRIVEKMEKGEMPERITHNDTKFNNVMIDDSTHKGICVIDLDTVMPGSPLYDFGDSVRIGSATALEDEKDLSKVSMNIGMFERLAHGYLDAARDFLLPAELALLAFSGKLLTFECGMRFLTDFLNGDVYFRKIAYETHNLVRCRTQFRMVEDMERQMEKMEKIVEKYK
jgi:heme oxygenase